MRPATMRVLPFWPLLPELDFRAVVSSLLCVVPRSCSRPVRIEVDHQEFISLLQHSAEEVGQLLTDWTGVRRKFTSEVTPLPGAAT